MIVIAPFVRVARQASTVELHWNWRLHSSEAGAKECLHARAVDGEVLAGAHTHVVVWVSTSAALCSTHVNDVALLLLLTCWLGWECPPSLAASEFEPGLKDKLDANPTRHNNAPKLRARIGITGSSAYSRLGALSNTRVTQLGPFAAPGRGGSTSNKHASPGAVLWS